jgi:hypothetical protein
MLSKRDSSPQRELTKTKQKRSLLMSQLETSYELLKRLQGRLHLIRNFKHLGTESINHGLRISALVDFPLTAGWIEFHKTGANFKGNLNVNVRKVIIKSRLKEYIQEENFGCYSHDPFDVRKLEEMITQTVKESITSI